MTNRFKAIIDCVTEHPIKKRCAVVCPDKKTVEAMLEAEKMGLIEPVFYMNRQAEGYQEILASVLEGHFTYTHESREKAAENAVKDVHLGKAHILLKGNLDTAILLKQVVNKEYGLLTGRLISHIALLDVPAYHKLIIVTDGGMVTYPDLVQLRGVLENAVSVMHVFGIDKPKVACLAAVEKVNERMPETVKASALKEMNQKGEISGCIVEGPISFDLAFIKQAAEMKGYQSPVAGDADIFLVPDLVSGNLLSKALIYAGGAIFAGVLAGASAPVIVTSRSSTKEEKINSIACSALLSSWPAQS